MDGDLNNTYQQYHPGVTTMWVAGLGLQVYAVTNNWSGDDLLYPSPVNGGGIHYPVAAGVAALGFVIAVCIGLAYVLLTQLVDWLVAFSAGCLLALDPFYIAQSKVLHVDALLANFMLLSVLFLICYLHQRRNLYLVGSSVFTGLAFLTKSASGFLVPFASLVIFFSLQPHPLQRNASEKPYLRGYRLQKTILVLLIWGLGAFLTFVLLWPAMWSMPLEVISNIIQSTLFWTETPHDNVNFFAGQVTLEDPGPFYYLATLVWRTTLITLPVIGWAIFTLLRQWKHKRDNKLAWWLLIYAVGFLLMLTPAAKKGERYLVPVFLALDVLAAWGLTQIARTINKKIRLGKSPQVFGGVLFVLVVLSAQTILVWKHHPYYGTHYNLLLGGGRVAQHILPLGDQEEGTDLAARFLNNRLGSKQMTVGAHERSHQMFDQYFMGRAQPIEQPNVDYLVFSINSIQRQLDIGLWQDIWEACQNEEPLWSVSFGGVTYAWIYRAYPYDPSAFPIDHRLDVQLEEHSQLLGYRLDSESIQAGDALKVTLFWQSDGQLTSDYHVFVHLLYAEEELIAQHDGVPGGGNRPTWGWRDTEIIQDEHVIFIDQDLPVGKYALSVGMYDFETGIRLSATRSTGESLIENRIPLEDIQVTP